jgi:hypothetical protein
MWRGALTPITTSEAVRPTGGRPAMRPLATIAPSAVIGTTVVNA